MSRNAYANMRLFLCFVLALMKTFEHNTACTVYSVDDQSVARFHGTIKNLISLGCYRSSTDYPLITFIIVICNNNSMISNAETNQIVP